MYTHFDIGLDLNFTSVLTFNSWYFNTVFLFQIYKHNKIRKKQDWYCRYQYLISFDSQIKEAFNFGVFLGSAWNFEDDTDSTTSSETMTSVSDDGSITPKSSSQLYYTTPPKAVSIDPTPTPPPTCVGYDQCV